MKAYKLVRKLKNGELTPLFINKKLRFEVGVWYDAENHPTKGFANRPFFHCTLEKDAPHLSMKDRVWVEVEIEGVKTFNRPKSQGGQWYLAERLKIIRVL